MAFEVGSSSGVIAPKINVTPLVDVVLVLLIIFMVITPLLTKKFWLNVPKKEEKVAETPNDPAAKPKNVVLSFHKDGQIRINGEVVVRGDLPDKLKRILAAKGDRLIFFDAEDAADYGEAVRVMDLARGAGATSIAILSESVLSQPTQQ